MLDAIFSWDTLYWLLLILYLPCCVALIVIVLLQKGKGTGFAGAFGVGPGSETIFGPSSARTLPQKLTYGAACVFMLLALFMTTISGRVGKTAAPELEDATGSSAADVQDIQTLDGIFGRSSKPATPADAAPAPAAETPAPAPAAPATPAPAPEAAAPVAAPETPAPAPAAEAPAPAAPTQ